MSQRGANGPLHRIRWIPHYHWLALVAGCAVGVFLATLHWSGLVIGGALVGLVAANLTRAVLSGIGFAVLALLVWATFLAEAGTLGAVVAMGELTGLAIVIAVGLSVLGSLVRGIV